MFYATQLVRVSIILSDGTSQIPTLRLGTSQLTWLIPSATICESTSYKRLRYDTDTVNSNFEPPYDIVTFFSIDFNLILDCPSTYSEKTTTTCHLPNNATSVVAPVNGITA
jgi:hypothetical protein